MMKLQNPAPRDARKVPVKVMSTRWTIAKAAVVFLGALLLLAGCKGRAEKSGNPSAAESTTPTAGAPPTTVESASPQYSDPPTVDVGITVEQAYAAIPHRRTIWVESDSAVPSEERAYLRVMFQALDQAVAVRVAGQQNFSSQRFDDPDITGDFDRLIAFVRNMPVPPTLASYHQDILEGLFGQRQFFADWKAQREQFPFAQQVGNDPDVRKASGALRAAYGQLMSKYPNETPTNKDAFFDYHCALDFL